MAIQGSAAPGANRGASSHHEAVAGNSLFLLRLCGSDLLSDDYVMVSRVLVVVIYMAWAHTFVNSTDVSGLLLENTLDPLKCLRQVLHLGLIEKFGVVGALRRELAQWSDLAREKGMFATFCTRNPVPTSTITSSLFGISPRT